MESVPEADSIRFTPAYAGKISVFEPREMVSQVHPRIRGEDL